LDFYWFFWKTLPIEIFTPLFFSIIMKNKIKTGIELRNTLKIFFIRHTGDNLQNVPFQVPIGLEPSFYNDP